MKQLRQPLIALLTKTFVHGFTFFSLKNCHRIGSLLGRVMSVIPNRSLHVTTVNVEMCFPDMSAPDQQKLIKNSLIETGKTLAEISPMWNWDKTRLLQTVKNVQGEEYLKQALEKNKGVILAAPHLGSWELLGHYLADKYPTTCMYQKPKVAQLDSIIRNGRERFGVKLVPADSQGIRAMLKSVKNNELICILPDQEPSHGEGVYIPFFNIQAYSMILISRFAKKTGATVLSIYAERLPNGEGYNIKFKPLNEIENGSIEDSVLYLNNEIEKCITEIPEQYQWSYKRFRTQPKDDNGKPTADYYNS